MRPGTASAGTSPPVEAVVLSLPAINKDTHRVIHPLSCFVLASLGLLYHLHPPLVLFLLVLHLLVLLLPRPQGGGTA